MRASVARVPLAGIIARLGAGAAGRATIKSDDEAATCRQASLSQTATPLCATAWSLSSWRRVAFTDTRVLAAMRGGAQA